MTAQILAAELGNLIQDSKRKNSELRAAAEKTLQDLRSLPNTSEAQLAADIARRPQFISPFLIACSTHNAKFASTGVSCLQRLSVSRALPRERLTEVLDALKESVTSSHDIQVKILQALPSLLQNYPHEIRGELLAIVLQICSDLHNAKNFAVSNTAAATLQQLVIIVFDRVASEDEQALEIPTVTEVKGDEGQVSVRPAANDAYRVFNDIVLLVIGEKPVYIRFPLLPAASILELIEAILSNHAQITTSHPEQIFLLRTLLMPLIVRSLSDRLSFSVTVRIVRLLHLIIRHHLNIFPSECEIALGLLNHMLDPEASQLWKRALCLEVFRSIYADHNLLLDIYMLFDAQDGKKKIFGDNLAAFVRLAVEKPAIIGLGQQSTIANSTTDSQSLSEQAVAEAGALAGVIGGPVNDTSSSMRPLGISTQWSALKTPCIEHLDKSDPPTLPETYVYSLVLTCVTNISESLAKFVLPLTVHHENRSRKRVKTDDTREHDDDDNATERMPRRLSRTQSFRRKTVPANPLDITDHPAYEYVKTSSNLVNECWPAIMATCSTFLNAALDTDYYRALIRAIQKFTQVAGLLRLSTPRDAFLTTMGKAAVPSNLLLANVASPKAATGDKSGIFSNAKGLLSVDSLVSQASSLSLDKYQRSSNENLAPTLGSRNLLCLRALLNLAIALGPTLQTAWSIVFETLQVADLVMALSSQSGARPGRNEQHSNAEKIDGETSAVQAAARRLFESTVDYPNESFVEVLQALCLLLQASSASDNDQKTPIASGRPQILHQRRLGSVSGISLSTDSNSRDSAFALNKIGELVGLNESRLAHYDPDESGWDIFVTASVQFSANNRNVAQTRLLAADILSQTIRDIAELSMAEEQRESIQTRILSALRKQITSLYSDAFDHDKSISDTDMRVHQITLEALKSMIEHCGESLVAGWGFVIDSLMSVFLIEENDKVVSYSESTFAKLGPGQSTRTVRIISRPLARSAFATANLVCSDFLDTVPEACLSPLVELLLRFCKQQDDLNMSLTAITFFWNVSDFVQTRSDLSSLSKILGNSQQGLSVYGDVQNLSHEGHLAALWLQILLNLSLITTDGRAEVRRSSIQTIQRIFENISDQLSADVWLLCLRIVLFDMVKANLDAQRRARKPTHIANLKELNETTHTVLEILAVLITTYADKLNATQFSETWSELLDQLQQYFEYRSHALGFSVFRAITDVMTGTRHGQNWSTPAVLKTASVWQSYFVAGNAWSNTQEGNQEAFVAYTDAFKALYVLADESITDDLPAMLANLEGCIVYSDAEAYSSDVDTMTTLQRRVLDCLASIRMGRPQLPSYLIQLLSRFILLPYNTQNQQLDKQGPTYVAFSKASMTLLQQVVEEYKDQADIYSSTAMTSALTSLAKPIQEKYVWQREGKYPTLWQKATITALAILDHAIAHMKSDKEIWAVIVNIAHYITRCHVLDVEHPPSSLQKDEMFDMQSFRQLRELITLPLGSPSLPDTLRRLYTRNIFLTSVCHTPIPGELPDVTSAPLEDLYKVRLGQTAVLEASLRQDASHASLSELFDLVAAYDGSVERVKLAQAAAPYVILRAALPLKTYIADQPLRGRMPTPDSQRRELLLVLEKLAELKTEPQAIPDAPGVRSKHKKHLHRLYPLLLKAAMVARQDEEVFEHLLKLTDMVGDEFGLEDD
ncbi:Endocytosis and vacuole integrity protein [Coniothyrium glycines]